MWWHNGKCADLQIEGTGSRFIQALAGVTLLVDSHNYETRLKGDQSGRGSSLNGPLKDTILETLIELQSISDNETTNTV